MAEVEDERDLLRMARTSIMRVFAVAWIAIAFAVWGRVVGALPAGISLTWHGAEGPIGTLVVGAILAPVVAVGLWLAASWGIVLWAAALSLLLVALLVTAPGLPFALVVLVVNGLALSAVCALSVARFLRDRDVDD